MIHVRRGDYLKFKEELPIFYYEKSIEFIKTKTKTTNFKIYTDDINWCKNQKLFNIADEILASSDSPDDTSKHSVVCLIIKTILLQTAHFH